MVLEGAKIEELEDDFDLSAKDIIRPSKPLSMCKIRHCVRKKAIRDTRMRVMKPCNSSDEDSDKVQINHCKLVKGNKLHKSRGRLNNRNLYFLIIVYYNSHSAFWPMYAVSNGHYHITFTLFFKLNKFKKVLF